MYTDFYFKPGRACRASHICFKFCSQGKVLSLIIFLCKFQIKVCFELKWEEVKHFSPDATSYNALIYRCRVCYSSHFNISGLLYGESIKLACNLTIQHLDDDHLKGTRLNNGQ